ncbi:hypothetical protein AB0I54_20590 [Streptomyces sp. NPDC050625]|uniref:hypothetical protein n=1 Tax=Streptomyces sp. NPDC050625 TaxID=3154629 RepID=UPI003420F26D
MAAEAQQWWQTLFHNDRAEAAELPVLRRLGLAMWAYAVLLRLSETAAISPARGVRMLPWTAVPVAVIPLAGALSDRNRRARHPHRGARGAGPRHGLVLSGLGMSLFRSTILRLTAW